MPEDRAVAFSETCVERMKARKVTPTELDLLFVLPDECLLSATYHQSGFAVSIAFENYKTRCPPAKIMHCCVN